MPLPDLEDQEKAMKDYVIVGYPMMDRPKTFSEEMREGKSMDDGLAGAKPMRKPFEKGFSTETHYPTRSRDDEYSEY